MQRAADAGAGGRAAAAEAPPAAFPLVVAAIVGLDALVAAGGDAGASAVAMATKVVALAHGALQLAGRGGGSLNVRAVKAPLLLLAFVAPEDAPPPLVTYLERQGALA